MTARTGMANNILRLRGMANVGTADYTVAGASYFTDDQLQEVLDANRTDLNRYPMTQVVEYEGGTAQYFEYRVPYRYFEEAASGSAVWAVEDDDGDFAGTSSYSADYINGIVRFTADQLGTAYWLRGRSYNLNAAAADVWRRKMAWRAEFISFSADDQSFSANQWFTHCAQMVEFYEGQGGMSVTFVSRSDLT